MFWATCESQTPRVAGGRTPEAATVGWNRSATRLPTHSGPLQSPARRTQLCLLLWPALLFPTATGLGQSIDAAPQLKATAALEIPQHELTLPLLIDDLLTGEVRTWIEPTSGRLTVDRAGLVALLSPKADRASLARLTEEADSRGRLTLSAIEDAGFPIRYEPQELELRISMPIASRLPTEVAIAGRQPPPGVESALLPSDFSAYLNLRSGVDVVHQSPGSLAEGRQPVRVDLENAFNFRNWVLDANTSFVENDDNPVHRREILLTRDLPDQRIRISAGDLAYSTTGFQTFVPLGGVTVARNFSLQPYRVTEPLGRSSFVLKSDSKVEVLVNGQVVRTLQLPAGPHSVRDFLFASGANDVVLRITDEVGRIETVRQSFYFDSRLLAAGEQEFAYSIGVPSRYEDGSIHYETDFPFGSVFHRVGVSDSITLGANAQGTDQRQLFGTEAVFASALGTLSLDAAGSTHTDIAPGAAARVQYRYYDAGVDNPRGRTYAAAVQYRSSTFALPLPSAEELPDVVEFSARYGQRLPWQSNVGVGGSCQVPLDGSRNLTAVNVYLSKRWGHGLDLELNLERTDTIAGDTDHRAFVNIHLRLGSRHTLNASYDSLADTSRLDWQYTPARNVGGVSASAGVQHTPDAYQFFGSATYTDYRFEAGISEDVATPTIAGLDNDVRTRLRFGTALVFADGVFGVSRPVTDSFAIVAPRASLEGQAIGTEPIDGTYSAQTSFLSPAVVPDLQAYQVRRLVTEAPDLPPGSEMGPDLFMLKPTYRSGTVIRVGTEATITVTGTLRDATGKLVVLQGGELRDLDDPSREPIVWFTNREGQFYVENLRVTTYHLTLYSAPESPLELRVPAGQKGLWQIGELQLSTTARPQ